MVIFWYNVILFFCFLGIFSYELLIVFLEQSFDWAEVVLCVWVFSFFVEEVYMVRTTYGYIYIYIYLFPLSTEYCTVQMYM